MMFLSLYDAEQRGMRRGIEQGLARGIEQGLALAVKENQRNIALRMLKRNKPLEEIAEDTGLTLEEVHSIKSGQSSMA
ncbi:MAG: hypothetical protein LBS11_07005 [Oscillospiraceae bacterium]|jgi:predicted transposase/invertase (TIGR01784 family)|nr:hypothetical protein [Oscillospiraceae bacterium]